MTEPTEEQIKEFWEWCGVKPKAHLVQGMAFSHLKYSPPIDLNNLFKYAVPFLQDKGVMVELYSFEQSGYKVSIYSIQAKPDYPAIITTDEDPALALFWAIWEVIKNDR